MSAAREPQTSGRPELVVVTDDARSRPPISPERLAVLGWLALLLSVFVAAPSFGTMACIRMADAALMGAAAIAAVRRPRPIAIAPLTWLAAGMLAVTAASAAFGTLHQLAHPSPYPSPIFGGTALGPAQLLIDQIAALCACYLVAGARGKSGENAKGLLAALQVVCGAVVLLCALDLARDHSHGARIEAGFGNPNLLASFLVLCVPVAVSIAILGCEAVHWLKRAACAVLGISALAALWFTGSRAALIGAAVSLALLAGVYATRRLGPSARRAAAIDCAALLLPCGWYAIHHVSALGGISHQRSDQQRLVVWHAAIAIARADPLTGTGLGGFPAAMRERRLREANPSTASGLPLVPAVHLHAHNIFLQMASERGIPGLLAVVALIGALLVTVLSRHYLLQAPAHILGAGAALIGLTVQNLFDYTLWYAPILILTWALVGIAARPQTPKKIVSEIPVLQLSPEPIDS